MSIEDWSDEIILVNLPWRLREHNELQRVVDFVKDKFAALAHLGILGWRGHA